MPSGGYRRNSGRKAVKAGSITSCSATASLGDSAAEGRRTQPAGCDARQHGVFHYRAAEVFASIMAMPLGADATADQLSALKDMAGMVKCRELAQQCARDLARYTTIRWPLSRLAPSQAPANSRQSSAYPHPRQSAMHSPQQRLAWHQSHASACDVQQLGHSVTQRRTLPPPTPKPKSL